MARQFLVDGEKLIVPGGSTPPRPSLSIATLMDEAAACSKAKGFHDQPLNVGEQLMLVVSEASEAMEDYRNSNELEELGVKLNELFFWGDDGGGPYSTQRTEEEVQESLADLEKRWASDMATYPTKLTPAELVERKAELVARHEALYKPCGFPSELADIVIRVANLAARMEVDLEQAIREKLRYNWTRAKLHGGKKV